MTLYLRVGAHTDTGRVRQINEDAYLVDVGLGLHAVADGMGGHRAGEVASALALDVLHDRVRVGAVLEAAVDAANVAVLDKASQSGALHGMGTTLTAVTFADDGDVGLLLIGHVGDSRAYLLRDSGLRRLTRDHSLVADLVEAGEITEEQALVDPRRSMITRALGIERGIPVDVLRTVLQVGDRVMLCSDGLTGMVRDDRIAELLDSEPDPGRAAAVLVDAANQAGGIDNITVLVLDVTDGEPEETSRVERGPVAAIGPSPDATADAPPRNAAPATVSWHDDGPDDDPDTDTGTAARDDTDTGDGSDPDDDPSPAGTADHAGGSGLRGTLRRLTNGRRGRGA